MKPLHRFEVQNKSKTLWFSTWATDSHEAAKIGFAMAKQNNPRSTHNRIYTTALRIPGIKRTTIWSKQS